jgi:hypothetical protein
VDEVEVDVIQAQSLQAFIQALLGLPMVCIPQLGCNEHIFAFYARLERLSKSFAHLILVAIHEGSVDVSVAGFQGVCNRVLNLCNETRSASIPNQAIGELLLRPGSDCHVPKPTAGIFAPVLRVKVWSVMVSGCLIYSGVLASIQFAN